MPSPPVPALMWLSSLLLRKNLMQDVVSGGVPPEANLEAGSLGQRVRCGADAGEAQREGGAGSGEDSPPAQAHQRAGGSAAPEAQPHGGPLRGCGITPWCRPTHAPGGLCVYPPVKLLHREGLLCTSCFLGQEKPASGRDWCLGGASGMRAQEHGESRACGRAPMVSPMRDAPRSCTRAVG